MSLSADYRDNDGYEVWNAGKAMNDAISNLIQTDLFFYAENAVKILRNEKEKRAKVLRDAMMVEFPKIMAVAAPAEGDEK